MEQRTQHNRPARLLCWAISGTLAVVYSTALFAQAGSVAGTVTYGGEPPKMVEIKVTKDVKVCGKEKHFDESLLVGINKGVQNVVVSIANPPKGKGLDALGSKFELHQTNCSFKPHILIAPVGKQVVIFNNDGILHNIHTYSKLNRPFNVAQPKFKKRIKKVFKKAEVIPVRCDVHGWMSGYIFVVDHPYYAITNEEGKYTLGDLPPGTYTLKFWHEKLGTHEQQVTVEAGKTATVDFEFPAAK